MAARGWGAACHNLLAQGPVALAAHAKLCHKNRSIQEDEGWFLSAHFKCAHLEIVPGDPASYMIPCSALGNE
jgi:hypothetical protein